MQTWTASLSPARGHPSQLCGRSPAQKQRRLALVRNESNGVQMAASSKRTESSTSTATFLVKSLNLKPGECVKVVGSPPELGSWNVSSAPSAHRHEGNGDWSITAQPSLTQFEFKLVVANQDSSVAEPRWEKGTNRAVQLDLFPGQSVQIICEFNEPASTELVVQSPGSDEGAEEKTPSAAMDAGSTAAAPLQQVKSDQEAANAEGPAPLAQQARLAVEEKAPEEASKPDKPAAWAAANIEAVWKTEGGGSLTVMAYTD